MGPMSGDVPVSSSGDVLEATGQWNQDSGMLIVGVKGSWEKDTEYTLSFTLINPSSSQVPFISCLLDYDFIFCRVA